ncbi:meiotic recombination protein REC8 homolog isoform X1 [Xenopus tropicalis]|uniref:Meiotic recombination protein REC8 homolog isoform X1 n=1 Tax=Xenopus tropicalis TaxID=8364 RepID=A0A8J1JME2_XENTR|nr:meiotic recombination protein REC8 homolog isoform X1 [Xenopus tropicalis]
MFYYPNVLQRHTGCFATIWLAATKGTKILKREYLKVNVINTCQQIMEYLLLQVPPPQVGLPVPRFSLYLSAQLSYGVVRVYHRQCDLLIEEMKNTLDRIYKAEKQMRIDILQPEQHALLPDALSLMEMLEDAPDPFFGMMGVPPQLPDPLFIPQIRQILEAPSPLRREPKATPTKPKKAKNGDGKGGEHLTSPERITLREVEPITFPSIELIRDLPEVSAHDLEFLMSDLPLLEEEPRKKKPKEDISKLETWEVFQVPTNSLSESLEEARRREGEIPTAELSPTFGLPLEPAPEADAATILDEITGEPVVDFPELTSPERLIPEEVSPSERFSLPASPQLVLKELPVLERSVKRDAVRRGGLIIDKETKIAAKKIQEQILRPDIYTQAAVPVVLPPKTPASLFQSPTYQYWMAPELSELWTRCALLQPLTYAEEKEREEETMSEVEALRAIAEPSGSLIMSSEISLEVSEEERSRPILLTPEERRALSVQEERFLPMVSEMPELMVELPETGDFSLDDVQRRLRTQIDYLGQTEFLTHAPHTLSRIAASRLFYSSLVLCTQRIIYLEQRLPYGQILITPGPLYSQH